MKVYTHRIRIDSTIGGPSATVIRYRDGVKFQEAICWNMEQLIMVLFACIKDEEALNPEEKPSKNAWMPLNADA